MQRILEMVGVLVILLVVLRFSLGRRGQNIPLRGGLTGLNIATGLLAGAVFGQLLAELRSWGGIGTAVDRSVESSGYMPLADALATILPLAGAAFGGMIAYVALGSLWRRLFVGGSASTRAWLLRGQFILCAVSLLHLLFRMAA